MTRSGKSFKTLLALCPLLLLAGTARAEDPAAAEVLFQEGRKLLSEGQVSAACEKLKDSFALDPMSGTLLNLAACYEKQGKMATAWARFHNAASLAKSQGKTEQAAEANRRIKALEGDLSYLTITVPEPVPGLEVKRDDVELSPGSYGVQVPVDPGPIQIVASAPGYRTVKLSVEIGAKRDKRAINIPKLDKGEESATEAAETPAATEPAESKERSEKKEKAFKSVRRTDPDVSPAQQPEIVSDGPGKTPWVIGCLGVAAGAAGGLFGYLAIQSNDEAKSNCKTRQNCSKTALDAADRRNQQALFADIGVGLGIVGVGTAAVWLLVAGPKSRDDSSNLTIQPSVARDSAGLWATGKF
jgi:tetratricopeptide (TPR) repeat protein